MAADLMELGKHAGISTPTTLLGWVVVTSVSNLRLQSCAYGQSHITVA